jgi:outer membrane lipoprotein-sorting protein
MLRSTRFLAAALGALLAVSPLALAQGDKAKTKVATDKAASKPAASAKEAAPDAQTILERAELIRNPNEDYSVHVTLVDAKNGKEDPPRTYESLLKGRDKALVKFLTPASESGQRVLMVGQDMWVFIPTSAKPMRVSANQKLTGNAAYGDITRLSFVGNYTAKLNRTDKYQGQTDAHVLDLTSIEGRPVTYDRVEYWVDAKTFRPLKTLYMSNTGKVIREGTFGEYEDIFGVQRPTKLTLVNSLRTDQVTTLKFSKSKQQKFTDMLFEKQNLGRN